MDTASHTTWIAFAGSSRIAAGSPCDVATAVKHFVDTNPTAGVLVFDVATSLPVELDLRGNLATVLEHLSVPSELESPTELPPQTSARGRPRLGVVAREVTLLPRHWEWLATQPGGASVALRKLVEQARRASADVEHLRQAQEAAYRFMSAMAGNEPGYEEAARALFAGELARMREYVDQWPRDVRNHTLALAEIALHKMEGMGEVLEH
jgi:hypothetical protein